MLAKDLGYIGNTDYENLKKLVWLGCQLLNGLIASNMKHLTY